MRTLYKLTTCILAMLIAMMMHAAAQNVPQGITYQGIARNSLGTVIMNQPVGIKAGIYSPTANGVLQWEEIHTITTNSLGSFNFIIGQGASTGMGALSSFSSIDWANGPYYIRISMDQNGGSSYVPIDTIQFWSVPYALYSGKAGSIQQPLRLHPLSDVDTTGAVSGYVLKWNGSLWLPAPDLDSDTALFAYNASNSITADTALYAFNANVDTVIFSYYSDTASYALNASNAVNAQSSNYCDTAVYALTTGSQYTYWNLTGNTGTNPSANFLGTTDNTDFVIKTNNAERMRFTSAGKIGVGVTAPSASFQVAGNDGFLHTGTFGSGTALNLGAGTRMHWYPKKGAFRVGTVTSTEWDDVNIGNYSFASGYSNRASGAYSTASGQVSFATGANSVAMGYACTAGGPSSISMGSGCNVSGVYAVGIGRASTASDTGAICIGYHSSAVAKFANAFGAYTYASGNYSTTMGYYANTAGKTGSFVYADASSSTSTSSTANNQFMVRAAGGVIFYSNSAMTAGVTLPAGGGSWTSLSDKNKKEHFNKESPSEILDKLCTLDVTTWNYKTQSSSIRHIGPMAQDFYKTFGFGESDTTITTVDIDGINLIAIQALEQRTRELKQKAEEVEQLKAMVEKLEKEKKAMEIRITTIEKHLLIDNTEKASR